MKNTDTQNLKTLSIKNLTDDQLTDFVKTKLRAKIDHIQRDETNNSIKLSIIDKNKALINILIIGKTAHYDIKYIDINNSFQSENANRDLRRKWMFYMTKIFGEKYISDIYSYLKSGEKNNAFDIKFLH